MNDRLNVRIRSEPVAGCEEAFPQFEIVVDFSVAHHGYGFIFVGDRLISPLEIDNAQAPKTQPDSRTEMQTLAIGPSVPNHIRHATEQALVN
jgi:hypothetical protein